MKTPTDLSHDVAAVVWPWRTPPAPPHRPGPAHVLLQACIPFAVAAFLYFKNPWTHARTASMIIAGIGTLLLLLGLFAPKAFTKVERFVFSLVGWIGVGLSWLLLTPLYFTFFLTARVWMTLRGKDPLHRKLKPDATSYWIERSPVTDPVKHYRRQF